MIFKNKNSLTFNPVKLAMLSKVLLIEFRILSDSQAGFCNSVCENFIHSFAHKIPVLGTQLLFDADAPKYIHVSAS